jgi:hypothetical protein
LLAELPVLIVGDVHGDLERLFQALKPYPAQSWHTIFLGDLVDGGPFGVGALRYARDRPNSTVLVGNHEALMLAALRQHPGRGPAVLSWLAAGGEWHDLEELARDPPLQGWLKQRPGLIRLSDETLVQHSDNDGYRQLLRHGAPNPVAAVNEEVRRLLEHDDDYRLWDVLTPRSVFRRRPAVLDRWLQLTGCRRVVHGHTPHRQRAPDAYHGGRAICYDGGLSRFGGNRYRRLSPLAASVGPLPPLL